MPTIKYKLANGSPVKGATTVAQQIGWGKQPLMIWANKQGLEGRTLNEARDTATIPGTIAHYQIECFLKGTYADLNGYHSEDLRKADMAFENFLHWWDEHNIVAVEIEPNWVSEEYQYGGTPDLIGSTNGRTVLIDWKTGRIFESVFAQLSAYQQLALEQGYNIEGFHVLRIPKNEDIPSFHHSYWEKLPDAAWEAFKCALTLSQCERELKKLL